jgi:hypothetical protein
MLLLAMMAFVGVGTGVVHLERDASNWYYQASSPAISLEGHLGFAPTKDVRVFMTVGYDRSFTFPQPDGTMLTGQSLTTIGLGGGWLLPNGVFAYGVLMIEAPTIITESYTESAEGFGAGVRAGKAFRLAPNWSLDVGLRCEIGRVGFSNGEGGNAATPTILLYGLTIGTTWYTQTDGY